MPREDGIFAHEHLRVRRRGIMFHRPMLPLPARPWLVVAQRSAFSQWIRYLIG